MCVCVCDGVCVCVCVVYPLGQLTARLYERLAPWCSGKPPAPHVTLVKFTYPFGDKKAKAASTQVALCLSVCLSESDSDSDSDFVGGEAACFT